MSGISKASISIYMPSILPFYDRYTRWRQKWVVETKVFYVSMGTIRWAMREWLRWLLHAIYNCYTIFYVASTTNKTNGTFVLRLVYHCYTLFYPAYTAVCNASVYGSACSQVPYTHLTSTVRTTGLLEASRVTCISLAYLCCIDSS